MPLGTHISDANGQSGRGRDEALQCVIWHGAARSGELPGELLSSLSKRISRISVCTDVFGAMARLGLVERERRREVRAGRAPISTGVLVIVQPVDRGEAVELIETIQLYAPGTGCWQYDRSQTPKFRAITDADVDSWLNEPPAGATATMPAKPSVHVAPTSVERVLTAPAQRRATPTHEQSRPAPKAPEVTTRRSSLLSEEEFQLLLGDVDVAGFPTPTPAPRVHPDQHGTSTRGDGGSIGGGGR